MAMTMPTAMYAPTSDVMDRHEYGITKSRKSSSTGGGRAWSEDEVRGLHRVGPPVTPGHVAVGDGAKGSRQAVMNYEERVLLTRLDHNRRFTFFRPVCRRCRTSTSPPT